MNEEEKTRQVLAIFAQYGVKECLLLQPAKNIETKAEITPEGELIGTDKTTGEKHKLSLIPSFTTIAAGCIIAAALIILFTLLFEKL